MPLRPVARNATSNTTPIADLLRGLRLRLERARLARRIRELGGLVDVPHEVADIARARIARLMRRERALDRLLR